MKGGYYVDEDGVLCNPDGTYFSFTEEYDKILEEILEEMAND